MKANIIKEDSAQMAFFFNSISNFFCQPKTNVERMQKGNVRSKMAETVLRRDNCPNLFGFQG